MNSEKLPGLLWRTCKIWEKVTWCGVGGDSAFFLHLDWHRMSWGATNRQTSNQKRWSDSTSPHLLLSLNRVKVDRLYFSLHPPHITQGLILFQRETLSPALRFPLFLFLQSDCCWTLPVTTETTGELPWNTPPGLRKVFLSFQSLF